jgi:hypothetical protein
MAEAAPVVEKTKKVKPTNCAQSNKRIRRKDWYFRNGKYFANKQCFKLYVTQEAEKAKKAAAAAAPAADGGKTTAEKA